MREYLHVGDKIVTLTGHEEITHIHDGVAETDSYEVGMDGDSMKVGERRLSAAEIGLLMREVDGKVHGVVLDEG